jgi:hypothetical protein
MKKLGLIVLVLLLIHGLAWGQAKTGTSGAQFLELGVSARAVGMGNAFLAVADDASAIYYNPAGLSQLIQREIVLTHVDYPADITYDFAGITYPVSKLGGIIGLGFYFLNSGDMEYRTYYKPFDGEWGSGQTFSAKDYSISLSYGRLFTERFSIGATIKFIDELYEEERATGWAADIGTMYNTGFRNFKIGMMMTNFGPDLKFIREAYPLPICFKFGIAMDVINYGDHRALADFEIGHPNDNLEKFNGGVEYWYRDMIALRVGSQAGYDAGDIGFGAGIKLPFYNKTKLKVDYAYYDFGDLSEVHRFTLNLNF